MSTSTSSLLSRLVVDVDIIKNEKCKIVDILRNYKIETVATDALGLMATAVAMDSRCRFSKR